MVHILVLKMRSPQPQAILDGFIFPTLDGLANLRVHLLTTVQSVGTLPDGSISNVTFIKRSPRDPSTLWSRTFSADVADWYSPEDSSMYTKEIITAVPPDGQALVVIDATSFGDLLVLSDAEFTQGAEMPTEASLTSLDTCGQRITYPFYIRYNSFPSAPFPPQPEPNPPGDFNISNPYNFSMVWSYRRSLTTGSSYDLYIGDISNQNYQTANDYLWAYPLLSINETMAQRDAGRWAGGLNLSVLYQAELTAYGWYEWYIDQASNVGIPRSKLELTNLTGAVHRLSKMPYMRDTRRSVGLDGFRLQYIDMYRGSEHTFGLKFPDRISIGDYPTDMHLVRTCKYPDYVNNKNMTPYYIPFRALTSNSVSNLLVTGLTMAQTFHANAATRLHPEEWSTGLAAGVSAALMVQNKWSTTREAYANVATIQAAVKVWQPLDWPGDEQ
jgi:hypothetical protein